MSIFLFSLVGIPPLAGFAGKFLLFSLAIKVGHTWLAIVAIINSVISLAVYLRIIAPMYYKKELEVPKENSLQISIVWTVSLLVTVIAGVGVQWLIKYILY